MSRPKPTVIFADIDGDKVYDVCAADAVYAVYYQGRPVTVRSGPAFADYPGPKYVKSSFPNAAHALNLADKLNQRFDTGDFYVVQLTEGRRIKR
mgnify:FL=1